MFFDKVKVLNKPVYCIPGNHDNPELLRHFFPNTPTNDISSIRHNKFFIIFINTQVIGQQYGQINKDNLKQVVHLLETNENSNVVIVIHHPPVSINSAWMDKIGLKNGDEFLKLVQNHQNLKLILFGHVHQEIEILHQHIQIIATPSTCYQFKPDSDDIQYDNNATAGYRLVKIEDDGTINSHVYRI